MSFFLLFCNCLISSSDIKIFSSMFFIFSFPLFLIFSKEKTAIFFQFTVSVLVFIKLLVLQTGIYLVKIFPKIKYEIVHKTIPTNKNIPNTFT